MVNRGPGRGASEGELARWAEKIASGALLPEDAEEIECLLQKYPYFPLLYFARARQRPQQETVFAAAVHAPDRILLKRYLRGRVWQAEREPERPMNPEPPQEASRPLPSTPLEPSASRPLAALEWPAFAPAALPPSTPLTLRLRPSGLAAQHRLELQVLEAALRHGGLAGRIRAEIQAFASQDPQLRRQRSQALIDRFLQEPIRISSPASPGAGKQGEALAAASIAPQEDVATETLARLHLRQQNFAEAIRIYRKLCLLFPHKSPYFEAQIRKITQSGLE
jgi:hypothetical protein